MTPAGLRAIGAKVTDPCMLRELAHLADVEGDHVFDACDPHTPLPHVHQEPDGDPCLLVVSTELEARAEELEGASTWRDICILETGT